MREILFRAKVKFERLISAKPNKKKEQVVKWVYWGVYGQTLDEIGNAFLYNVDGLRVVYIDTARRFIVPETIGQHTGSTDKNGKKIFEGDIGRYKQTDGAKINCKPIICIGKVVYNEKTASFAVDSKDEIGAKNYDYFPIKDFEIIGNIHDNPELLEGENDKL